jgi:hypothetical protein
MMTPGVPYPAGRDAREIMAPIVPDFVQYPLRSGFVEVGAMLYHCQFTWFPGTRREEVARRVVQQHDAGLNHQERIRGWYNLVGGGSGFLIVDYDDPREVTAFLQPYMDLMSFDVRAIYELEYEQRIEQLRAIASQRQDKEPVARMDYA